MSRLIPRFLNFLSIPLPEKLLFGEAVYYLYTSKLLLVFLPFRTCVKMIACSSCDRKIGGQAFLKNLRIAIARANHLALWKNVCLVETFAARRMLNKRNIQSVLSIGVAKGKLNELKAHAWISSGDVPLVLGHPDYTWMTDIE